MFEAKVYTTAILSLSGMMDETHTARETVSRFNQQHAASTGRLFLPVDDPQTADVVIGIVWTIGLKTPPGWTIASIRASTSRCCAVPSKTLKIPFPASTVRWKLSVRASKAAAGA